MEDNTVEVYHTSDQIIDTLKSQSLVELYKSNGINSVIVFGSVVTESFEDYSDVDIAILSEKNISLNSIIDLEEHLRDILKRDIDIIDLTNEELDLRMKVSIYDNGLVVYNDKLNLYEFNYNIVDRTYKENEEFRYFRERDVIYDE